MITPTTLSQYPWVVVRIECVLCPRKGCYRLARLAARYGPEQSLEGLLADLAHDCPWWRTNPRKYEPRCGARFVDLERNLPPADVPPGMPYEGRPRPPKREDVPNRKTRDCATASAEVPMLSNWPRPTIVIICDSCGRRDAYDVKLLMGHGDVRLTDLRLSLTLECPRRLATSIYEQCGAKFDLSEG